VWPCIIYISKKDVPTWCKEFYYDFFLINGLYMFRTFTCPSSGVLIYRLFRCRMWCYAIGVEAVVPRSWCVVLCTVCQLVCNTHDAGWCSGFVWTTFHSREWLKVLFTFYTSDHASSIVMGTGFLLKAQSRCLVKSTSRPHRLTRIRRHVSIHPLATSVCSDALTENKEYLLFVLCYAHHIVKHI